MIKLAAILSFVIRIGDNYNLNKIFEYDNSFMFIQAVFGSNKHQKYIQIYWDKMQRKKSRFSVNKPDLVWFHGHFEICKLGHLPVKIE